MKKYVIYFIFLSLSFLKLNGQNLITVPFSNGFVGDNSANNNSTNVYYTAGATGVGLGWTNLQFTQNSTASIFTLQGNDIVGSVLVTDASGLEKTIDGFIKWRAPSGSVTTMCFQPTTGTNVTLATNGTNGSSTYTITDTKYIGLTFNGQTLSISGVPGSVSGNAATSGLLDLLNNYLTLFPKLSVGNATVVEGTATITVPVTLSAAPTSDVKVYFSVSNGSAVLTSDFLNPTIPASGYFTFLASQPTLLTKNITIPIVNNAINEPTEYFNVILSDPTNASITDGLGIVTITDNDPIPTADAGPATAVICSNGTYTTTGTATNGTIAWTSSGTGTFANATLGATLYTPSAADIAAGTVTLTMSVTGSGLTVTDNVVLTINEVPTNISASVTTQPSSTVSTGTITVAAPTGANYLYSVNGSTYQPGLTFSSLAPGSYSVTVKNNTSGCISNPVLLTVNSYAIAPAPAVAAGTCDPESLYDLIVSAFHQSVAQKNDGSWSGWGQHMDSDGSTSVTTPQDINVANYPGLTGIPLIATTASNIQDEQSVLLTTTGLFAWGVEGVAIPDAITTSTTFQKITINGKTDGLPTGVSPSDVQSLVAIHNNLILRTINGFAYILSCNTSGVTTANLYGDGSTSINNNWHQVKINATTALSNIIALRGQVASDTKGAFVALTYSASGYKAYTWGMSAYKGDNTSASALGYATEMTLPSGVTPRMIAITGGFYDAANTNTPLQRNNSYYLVATNGNVYGLGANDVKQLGDLTTTERKTWVQPKLNASTFLTNVKYLSAQEHDSRHPAVGVITNSGDLYLWGQNGGNMLGSSNTDASFDPFFPSGFTSGVDIAKVLEVGGHTTVYLKENSAKFCYVGHKTQGSMGDGITTSSNPFTFNCDATPVMNICGSTGWDLGDAPIVYENGGGSNYAQHFYIENSTKLYLGTSAPIENDDNPHSVIIATDNNGSNGDGTEENGIATFPTILNTATSYSFNVSLLNNSGLTANLYVWVDWNNNGKFEASEYKTTTATTSVSPQTKTISYTGLSGITDGRRYVRARLSTYSKADVTGTTNVDERSLGVLMDGEIEDYSLFVTTSNPNPNQFPITNDVTNAAILPLNASATDLDDASSSDSDGTVVAYRIIALPTHGTLYKQVGLSLVAMAANEAIVAADFAVLKYQPGANYAGNDVFTYTAIDDDGAEDQTPANFNIVVFVVSPSSDAGLATTTICANSTLTLNGTASNGTLLWSTLGSGTFSDATISNPIYTPSAADKAAGSVTLTLTVTGTSSTAVDSIIVTIAPLPTVDAGNATAAVCSGNNLSLNGTATNGTSVWTSTGTGSFNNANSLTSTYTPSATDISNGSVILYLTNTGTGSCSSVIVQDSLQLSITATPSTPVGSVTVQPTCATTTGTIVFTSQSGVEYSINGTTYQASATFTGVAAGSYTLKVRSTTDNTCSATGATITVNAAASAPSTPVGSVTVQPTCATTTGTIVFTTQTGVEYSINGTTYQSSATFTGVVAGSYTLRVRSTTDNTCTATGATVTVNAAASAPSTPVGSVTVQPTCATTTGTIVFTTQSGVEYSINGTTYQSSSTFTGVSAGSYTLKVRSTTDNTCSATGATVTVNAAASAPSTPVGSVSVQPTCATTTGTIVFTTQTGVEYSINGTTYQSSATFTGVAAGSYTLKVRSTTDNTCTATGATVTVYVPICAITDTMGPINGLIGETTASVLSNDTLNGVPVISSSITLTGLTVPPGLTLNPNGTITISPNTPAGTLTLTYQICENLNPTNCDTATVTVTVEAAAVIDAISDTFAPINGLLGATTASILTNDTLNGVAITASAITLTGVTIPTGLTLNPNGTITIAPNTPAGTLTLTYQICENLNPTNCDTATVTITVAAAVIDAITDTFGPINGLVGATTASVLVNDTLDEVAVTASAITLTGVTVPTGLTLNPNGSIDIANGTPAGTYSLTYQICENLNPTNCDTAVVTIIVTCNSTKVSGFVFNAGSNNTPLANVPITLTPINIVNGINNISGPSIIQITNSQGNYNYNGIPPGNYMLQVQDANLNVAFNLYNVTSSFLIINVEQCNYLVRNFSYNTTLQPVLGDFIWYDVNNNGLQDEWYDANNDGLVTKNIPDSNGIVDSTQWEWIDFNGDNSYLGLVNYGELNAAGFSNLTTNIPNLFISGPNGYNVDNTIGVQGFWGVRPPLNAYGIYNIELIMQSNLRTASLALAATGLIKVLPGGPAFRIAHNSIASKNNTNLTTNNQSSTICRVSNQNPQIVDINANNLVKRQLDFGISCKEFGAVDDIYTNNTSLTSGTLGNVMTNDILNGVYVATDFVNFSVVSGSYPTISIDNLGNVNITSGTPAGNYVFVYSLCDELDATNCVNATVTITVVPAVIDAISDTAGPINGLVGATTASVLTNDTLNGVAVIPSTITLTGVTVPTGLTLNANGTITIAPNTPAGTLTLTYQICENLNPTNCDTATVTITVVPAAIDAISDTVGPINGLVGATTASVLANDTLNGVAVTASAITLTGVTIPTGLTLNPNGTITIAPNTPAGTLTLTYQICENLNPTNCDTATVTITVAAAVIDAISDTAGPINGLVGATTASVLTNDTLNGVAITASAITLTGVTVPTGLTLNPNGTITIAPNTPAGTLTLTYQICENLNPTNCDTATVTITVAAAVIDAIADTAGPINGLVGATTASVLTNDTLNGVAVIPSTITLTGVTVPTGLTLNPNGTITIAPNTPAGTLTLTYQICENLNPTNCDTATVTITVVPAVIDAISDTVGPINGLVGATTASVLANDTLNGVAVTASAITLTGITVPTGLTLNPNGTITIAPNTSAGTLTLTYQICENLNPTNCDTATVTITVAAAVIDAISDTVGPINGLVGATTASILTNDTLNGVAVIPSTVTLTGVTVPTGLTLNPNGTITIAPNTPAGTLTLTYQICENLNPTNCDTATVTITVGSCLDFPLNDCDGDGVTNGQEISNGTNPNDSCSFILTSQTFTPSLQWLAADCDGDGVTNGQEINDGTNPLNPCSYNASSQTLTPNSQWLSADCDGDGVTNGQEIIDGTDLNNPCEADMSHATLPLTQEFLEGDCDGDGLTNGEEIGPNPNAPFDPNGNGIPDYLEVNNHTPSDDDLEIFNLVTPNGDGDNDVFVIRNIERYPENELEIYNRWGVKVYSVDGYGQDGKFFRGISEGRVTVSQVSELPVGTYWYVLKYKNATGEWKQRVGYLYLNK